MKQSIKKIYTDVFLLSDKMFPLYLITGEKNVLIDCSILANTEKIDKSITTVLGNSPLHYVFLTHSHYDHTGACPILQKKYKFTIFCSKRTQEILQNPDTIQFIDDLNQKFKIIKRDSSDSRFTMPENINPVQENDKIIIGSTQFFEVYETPGHTRCSISFLVKPQNILFCGDAAGVIEKNGKIKPLFLSSYVQYVTSIKKLQNLNAELLALPHNQYIKGKERIIAFFTESLTETQRVKQVILENLVKNEPTEKLAEKILEKEFPKATVMGPRDAMLINVMAMIRVIKKEFITKEII